MSATEFLSLVVLAVFVLVWALVRRSEKRQGREDRDGRSMMFDDGDGPGEERPPAPPPPPPPPGP